MQGINLTSLTIVGAMSLMAKADDPEALIVSQDGSLFAYQTINSLREPPLSAWAKFLAVHAPEALAAEMF